MHNFPSHLPLKMVVHTQKYVEIDTDDVKHTPSILSLNKDQQGFSILRRHTYHFVLQGVVTYMSPVEAFATVIKVFDRQGVLDHLIVPF